MRVKEAILLDKTGREMASALERIAAQMPETNGSGGGDSDGSTSLFAVEGKSHGEKLWNAMNTGGRYTGNNKVFTIDYDCCTPGSKEIYYVKWWIAYRDTYPKLADGVDVVFKDIIFTPELSIPILLQFQYGSGSITFEHCTFRNISFWFGRQDKQTITFRDCTIEDNQYHFLTAGEWNQNAEYHFERCHFRHMRPNFEEYRADIHAKKLVGWAYGNIRSMGFNIKWFFRDTVFEDNMGALNIMIQKSSHVPATDPKYVELYMERCLIQKTNGAGLSFSGQPVTGVIRDCIFRNIGANRCNGEGYDLPEDSDILSGSGTEDDPYIYKCGVGSNAIFSYNWTPRHELTISNNWMYNMMENGVEGNFRELSYNHIENTGYRMDEGMWNPSTEGIYGTFAVCKGNVIINPTKHEPGIVITGWSDGADCYYEDNVLIFDKAGEENDAHGFELMIQTQQYDGRIFIRNNDIRGFPKKYSIYNQYSIYLDAHIVDIGEKDNALANSDMYQRSLAGIEYRSDEAVEIVRDPYFYELNEDGTPKEWHILYGDGGVYTTGVDRYIRVKGTSLSACGVIAQDYHLNSDLYIATVRCQVRTSSGKIGFCAISLKDDGSVADDAYNMVLHPNMISFSMITEGDLTKFVEVTHSMVVSQNCRICIVDPDIDDTEGVQYRSQMDVKNVSVQLSRCQRQKAVQTDEALAVPGQVYDFANLQNKYLPSNAFTVTYWLPWNDRYSYTGSWNDATWMMGRNTGGELGRGRIIVNQDTKQYGQFVVWYESEFDLELNGHTLECANQETYSFLALFNGADVHIKGPGTIKAKNYALALSAGCKCTIDPDVVIEATGVNNAGDKQFAVALGGNAEHRASLTFRGGTIGKLLAQAYSDITFDITEGGTFKMERMQTFGKIIVKKDTKVTNNGTDPATEVTNIKQMTGLFTCADITAEYAAGHTEADMVVVGDESVVNYHFTNADGGTVDGESSLTKAFELAAGTRESRKGTFYITLESDIYTYTGLYFTDSGALHLDLNGHSIRTEYQSYALNLNGSADIFIMDSNRTGGDLGSIESADYCAIITHGIQLHIGRCIVRQATGIAVGGNGGLVSVEEGAQLVGKIGINAGTDTAVELAGGSIAATAFGIQATPEENSTTAVTVRSGSITSDNVTVYAKKLTFDAAAGSIATLKGELSLTEPATIKDGTVVKVDGEAVDMLQRYNGTVTAQRKEG